MCRLCRNHEQAAQEDAKRAASRTRIGDESGLSFAEIARRKQEAQEELLSQAASGQATVATPVAMTTAGGSTTPEPEATPEPDLEIELAPEVQPTPAGAILADWLDTYEPGAFQCAQSDLLIVRVGGDLHFWRPDKAKSPPSIVPDVLADYVAHAVLGVDFGKPITGAVYG